MSVTATPVDTISIQNKKSTDAISRNVFVADTVISTCVSELFKMKMRNSCIICNRRNNEIWEQGQGQVQCIKQCVIAARCGQWCNGNARFFDQLKSSFDDMPKVARGVEWIYDGPPNTGEAFS